MTATSKTPPSNLSLSAHPVLGNVGERKAAMLTREGQTRGDGEEEKLWVGRWVA